MSDLPKETPWIIAVIVALASSPLSVEIYKQYNKSSSLEEKYNSSIREAIQAYFDIEKEVFETHNISVLNNYTSGQQLNFIRDRINKDKNNYVYRKTDKQDLDIQTIRVNSDELEAKSTVSVVESWRRYSFRNNECLSYSPRDYYLLDVTLKRRNNKWLVDNIKTVEEGKNARARCDSGSQTNKDSGGSNKRTTVSGG